MSVYVNSDASSRSLCPLARAAYGSPSGLGAETEPTRIQINDWSHPKSHNGRSRSVGIKPSKGGMSQGSKMLPNFVELEFLRKNEKAGSLNTNLALHVFKLAFSVCFAVCALFLI